jgi:formiminoglutamate deiminase
VRIGVERLVLGGRVLPDAVIEVDEHGMVAVLGAGNGAGAVDVSLGTAVAGAGNAHSHAFHRGLRGRTHGDGGDFWVWRQAMYALAGRLEPDTYGRLAEGVFGEMLAAGWTAVGEFHYVHHRPDGTRYDEPNAVGLALAAAARRVGIRLTLLDTLYLTSAPGERLLPEQRRFGDGDVEAWLARWQELAGAAGGPSDADDTVTIGAAVHSVRAVPPEAIARIAAALPAAVPLHVHLSEQPAENAQSLAAYRVTPTRLLADAGALSPRTSVVHATHLTADDIDLLGAAGSSAVFCPTTEADLGDGIGPARELVDAGAALALGSDQNAVVDPFLETRALEAGERLRSGRRGRFSPAELDDARSTGGYRALGLAAPLTVGGPADLVEVDAGSVRTTGSDPTQLVLTATAADVLRVVVGGRVVADRGMLVRAGPDGRDPAALLAAALEELR